MQYLEIDLKEYKAISYRITWIYKVERWHPSGIER